MSSELFKKHKSGLKKDILTAISVLGELTHKYFSDNLELAYFKGSAIKKWDTFMDYVPVVSDLDIHIKLIDAHTSLDFEEGIQFSKEYEELFAQRNPDPIHLPRIQVMFIDDIKEKVKFVPSDPRNIEIITGEYSAQMPDDDFIQSIDLENALNLIKVLDNLPKSVIERNGLEHYHFLRSLTWKVSPAPVRILSQYFPARETWTWNRSTIHSKLQEIQLDQLANHYQNYYEHGWQLFDQGFDNIDLYREMYRNAFSLLKLCFHEARKIELKK